MNVVIDGAYGFDNLGDEAMLHTAIQILRNSDLIDNISVSSCSPEKIKNFHGVSASRALLLGNIIRQLRSFSFKAALASFRFVCSTDVLVFAGGSILNDKKGYKDLLVILYKILLYRILGKQVMFWGVAFDQPSSRIGRFLLDNIVKLALLVIFRDEKSKKLTENLGWSQQHVYSGVDILFSLLPWTAKLYSSKEKIIRENRQIGLSLRPYPPNIGCDVEGLDDSLCEKIVNYLSRLSDSLDNDLEVVPLIFSDGKGQKNDRSMIERVEKALPNIVFKWPEVKISQCKNGEFNDLLEQYLSCIAGLDFVVGERFHALVLAQMLEVPYVAISYDKKIDELAKLTDMDSSCINLLSGLADDTLAQDLFDASYRVMDEHEQITCQLHDANVFISAESKNNQAKLLAGLHALHQ